MTAPSDSCGNYLHRLLTAHDTLHCTYTAPHRHSCEIVMLEALAWHIWKRSHAQNMSQFADIPSIKQDCNCMAQPCLSRLIFSQIFADRRRVAIQYPPCVHWQLSKPSKNLTRELAVLVGSKLRKMLIASLQRFRSFVWLQNELSLRVGSGFRYFRGSYYTSQMVQ